MCCGARRRSFVTSFENRWPLWSPRRKGSSYDRQDLVHRDCGGGPRSRRPGFSADLPAGADERAAVPSLQSQSASNFSDVPAGADERAAVPSLQSQPTSIASPGARKRAAALESTPVVSRDPLHRATAARAGYGPNGRFDDRVSSPLTTSAEAVTTVSKSDLEWPQIGVGFGLGVLLALGLFMLARSRLSRPVAQ